MLVAERDHVIYRYGKRHSSDEPQRGTVVADASNLFDALSGLPDGPIEAGCFSHARRYFCQAISSDRQRATTTGASSNSGALPSGAQTGRLSAATIPPSAPAPSPRAR